VGWFLCAGGGGGIVVLKLPNSTAGSVDDQLMPDQELYIMRVKRKTKWAA
jgi:hypothetical protein